MEKGIKQTAIVIIPKTNVEVIFAGFISAGCRASMRALFASVAILLSMLWSLAAPAATFYVDPVLGSDSYDGRGTNASGTTNRPFLTISRALDASGTSAGPGDTVYLRGGVYRGNTNATYCMPANIAANGTEDQPIAVVAYQNERPIIKGSQVARGPWVQVTGAEFTTNGFPAAGSNYIYKLEHWMCDTNGKLMLSYGQWSYLSNPQQVFVSASETNDGASLIQVSWPTSTNTTPPSSQFARNWGTAPPISIYQGIDGTESNMFAGSFYYREVTNAPGISDVSTVYVWLSDNSNPTNHVVEISTSTFVLGSLSGGGNYINYTNLAFRHSNQAAWGQGGGVIGVGAGGIMDSCDIQWLDYVGINVGPDGAITRSTISHIGRLGLSANAGARVDSCYMSACNYRNFAIGWEAGAIKQLFGSAGALIQNCEFTGNYGVSIWFDSVNQTNEVASIVRHNYIHNNVGFSEWEWDGPNYVTNRAMPQIQLEASRNVLVYNNLLVSNSTYSITLPGAQNCQVYNNIIIGMDSDWVGDGAHPWGNFVGVDQALPFQNNEMYNNIFYNNIGGPVTVVQTNGSGTASGNICDYNLFYNTDTNTLLFGSFSVGAADTFSVWQQTSGFDQHSVVWDPGLVGPFNMEYALGDFKAIFDGAARSYTQKQLNGTLSLAGGILTGALQLAAGSSGAPSLVFGGDASTGIYHIATGAMGIVGNVSINGSLTATHLQVGVSSINSTPNGTYTIDFSSNGIEDIQVTANYPVFTTTNLQAGIYKTLFLNSGVGSHVLTWPASWIWMGAEPTNLPGSTVGMLKLTARGSNDSTVVAEWQTGSYSPPTDTNAAAFFVAAGITNGLQIGAVNRLCLDLKAHGLWSKFTAIYPFVGGNASAHSRNLLGSSYTITWHGTLTNDANGVTGDGSTGYGDTGLIPASAMADKTNSMYFVWCKTVLPCDQGHFFGCTDTTTNYYRCGLWRNGSVLQDSGLNANSIGGWGPLGMTNFAGGMAFNRTSISSETMYFNTTNSIGGGVTATGLPNNFIYLLARDNELPSADHFSNANLSAAAIGQNFSASDMAQLMIDFGNFEVNLGR